MHAHYIKTLSDYVCFLRNNIHEVENLLKDLLIGVTRFFRDAAAFNALRYKVLPKMLKNKPKDYHIRVWVPGCSTGEEAYSIAILLHECISELGKDLRVQIFATDIDLHALEIARSGTYPETIALDIAPEYLKRFFTKNLNQYKIKKEIRSKVIFGKQNIIKDPPFTKLDLLCCRNVLIYLNTQLQKKILPLFHYSLKSKGILFLGMSEAIAGYNEYFEPMVNRYKIFERKDAVTNTRMIFGYDTMQHILDFSAFPSSERDLADNTDSFHKSIQDYIVKNFTPPCIVINKYSDIVYAHGNTEQYFYDPVNKNNLSISQHALPEIKMALMPILHKVILFKKIVIYNNLELKISKKVMHINLRVMSLDKVNILHNLILVIFENAEQQLLTTKGSRKSTLKQTNLRLAEVVQELQYTKENLQSTIEELETGNEELQSANEELQSTNEEIETSKEELQSLNEELIVVNTELQGMIDRLAVVNDDMTNLFNSTEIAAFFLDNNLLIKRYTPKAQEVMHLIPSDIGRSFRHFASTLKDENLINYADEVLRTLNQKNYNVQSKDNRWYRIRILPYRTLTNVIDGVIITMSDITKFKEYEYDLLQLNQDLQNSLAYNENIVNTVREPLLVLNSDLKIVSANHSFFNIFEVDKEEINEKFIHEISDNQLDTPQLRELLTKVISENQIFEDYPLSCNFNKIGKKEFLLNARKILGKNTKSDLILLTLGLN